MFFNSMLFALKNFQRPFLGAILVFSFIFLESIPAEEKKNETTPKVAYIDIENIIENSFLKKNFHEEYLRRRQEMQKTKAEKENTLFQLKSDLQKRSMFLGHEEFIEESKEIQNKLIEYEAEILKIRKSLKDWENDTMAVIYDELMLVMEIISAEENIQIILSKEPNVIYGRSDLDYTARVIDLLNDIDERNSVTAK